MSHYDEQREQTYARLPPKRKIEGPTLPASAVKSDGSSASYYEFTITNDAGQRLQVQVKDVIRCMCDNDFDLGNILKACRRITQSRKGLGKEGTSTSYDLNKIIYSALELKRNE